MSRKNSKSTASNGKSNRKGRIENLKPWKKGQSGNPNGRRPESETWAGILKWAGRLTGLEAAAISPPELAREFKKLGHLTLQEASALRVHAAILFDPSASLLTAIMDRTDGKLAQPLDVNWREQAEMDGVNPHELYEQFVAAAAAKLARASDGGSVSGSEAAPDSP